MEKVFETREGVVLYFDANNYTYQSDNIDAVKAALREDLNSPDLCAAIMAHNILTIMSDMDRVRMAS